MDKHLFTFVNYNDLPYPDAYQPCIHEVAAHFDKTIIGSYPRYSLHTEYSYGKRKFDSEIMRKLSPLSQAHRNGIPQLWSSLDWTKAFADFIFMLTDNLPAPEIIEIHPPFNDYCCPQQFSQYFSTFEQQIHRIYSQTKIVIENRSGSLYRGGKFLFSNSQDIVTLCNLIEHDSLNLGIVLDFPQLLTAEKINTLQFNAETYKNAIERISQHRHHIKGIHIWGKKKSRSNRWIAHCGTLDTYFNHNSVTKQCFIAGINEICNDPVQRYFVPEINSGAEDLKSVLTDLFDNTSP